MGQLIADARCLWIAAAFHAVATLPPGQDEQQAVKRAAAMDVAIEGLGAYATGHHSRDPALVIGYAAPA